MVGQILFGVPLLQSYIGCIHKQPTNTLPPLFQRQMSSAPQLEATIFSSPYCHWCTKAKAALTKHNIPYYEREIRSKNDLPPGTDGTVPQITINGRVLGGYPQLLEWLKTQPPHRTVQKDPYCETQPGVVTATEEAYDGNMWEDESPATDPFGF